MITETTDKFIFRVQVELGTDGYHAVITLPNQRTVRLFHTDRRALFEIIFEVVDKELEIE